jgi:hypothetical protein
MMTLSGDRIAGVHANHWEIADPSPEQITESVDQLDGSVRTEISVSEDEPFRYLSVAGGPRLFLVTGETPDGDILQLRDADAGSEQVSLVCGGQRGVFARSDLVARDAAVSAVVDFLDGFPHGLGDAWQVG